MKMIYFSADRQEVAQLGQELNGAGIAWELRNDVLVGEVLRELREVELWIRNDSDCHRAMMLCVAQHAGFAKQAARAPTIDELWEARLAA